LRGIATRMNEKPIKLRGEGELFLGEKRPLPGSEGKKETARRSGRNFSVSPLTCHVKRKPSYTNANSDRRLPILRKQE